MANFLKEDQSTKQHHNNKTNKQKKKKNNKNRLITVLRYKKVCFLILYIYAKMQQIVSD